MACRIMQLQTIVCQSKENNLSHIQELLSQTLGKEEWKKEHKVDIVSLPEMFTTPYETGMFPQYAEPEGGKSWQFCSKLARDYGIYLSAGSIPEIDADGKVYNTAYVFDRQGRQIAKHRKVHLFDVDIKGGQYFKESDTLSAGDEVTVFDTEFGKMGICICYDLRFPELCRRMVEEGAKVIFVPASFNMTTGPVHWEILFRQRAIDNQCYMLGTSTARDEEFSYISWGHSIAVSPWGDVISQMEAEEAWQMVEIDFSYIDQVRQQLPLLKARRKDIY